MKLYLLFLLMAAAVVASPGPGVVMTLSNALRHGLRGTIAGILGIACGAFVIAAISATSLGVLLAASALAFTVLKFIGAAYLVYLGLRLWRAPPLDLQAPQPREAGHGRRFIEGLSLQFTNPKPIFFFLSVFPQFIDSQRGYALQFITLVLTYSTLVVLIHCGYALFAQRARGWLGSRRGGHIVNKTAAATFVCFGVALANARR